MRAFEQFDELLVEVNLLLNEARTAFEASNNSITPTERQQYLSKANAFTRSGIVLLCGHFEGFIKEVIVEFSAQISDAALTVDFLPIPLLESVLNGALKKCASGGNAYRNQLKELIDKRIHVIVESSAIGKTGGNPTVDTIEQVLERIGIPEIIEQLSYSDFNVTTYGQKSQIDENFRGRLRQVFLSSQIDPSSINSVENEIYRLIDAKWIPKTQRRSVGYVATIQELLKRRNLIAHGEGYPKVTDLELEKYIIEIRKLAEGIDQAVTAHLAAISAQSASP